MAALLLLFALLVGADGLRNDALLGADGLQNDATCLADGVFVVDDFLEQGDIAHALSQMQPSSALGGGAPFGVRPSGSPEQYFVVDMNPSVAARIQATADAALGFPESNATTEEQRRLPARTIYGPAEAHRDDPKTAPRWSRGRWTGANDDELGEADRAAYRGGYAALVYLGGDGELRVGDERIAAARGRLVLWPNAAEHASTGAARRVLGPFAVRPGAAAPLWLTTKGPPPGVIQFVLGNLCLGTLLAVPQIIVGHAYLDDDRCNRIPEYLMLSGSLKLAVVGLLVGVFTYLALFYSERDEDTREEAKTREKKKERIWNVASSLIGLLILAEVAVVIFGAVMTVMYFTKPSGCPDAVLSMAGVSYSYLALMCGLILATVLKGAIKDLLEDRRRARATARAGEVVREIAATIKY